MITAQVLPLPGPAYSQEYFNQLVRAMGRHIEEMTNPGDVACSSLIILQIPHSGGGLKEGSVWSNNGVLYIVEPNVGYPSGVSATVSRGTVTVTTV